MNLEKAKNLIIITDEESYLKCYSDNKELQIEFQLDELLKLEDGCEMDSNKIGENYITKIDLGVNYKYIKGDFISSANQFANNCDFWNIEFHNVIIIINYDEDSEETNYNRMYKCSIKIPSLEESNEKGLVFKGNETSFIKLINLTKVSEEK